MHFLLSMLTSVASQNTLTTCRNIFVHLICSSLLLPFLKPGYIGSDLRKTWSVIKQIISKKEPEQRFNNMKDSSGSYSNPTQIATKFNNFFANVGPSLANKISPTQITYREFLIGHYAKCFCLNPTSPTEVANIVHSLKNSKCEGFYGLSISPVKDTIDLMAAL